MGSAMSHVSRIAQSVAIIEELTAGVAAWKRHIAETDQWPACRSTQNALDSSLLAEVGGVFVSIYSASGPHKSHGDPSSVTYVVDCVFRAITN